MFIDRESKKMKLSEKRSSLIRVWNGCWKKEWVKTTC